MPKDPDVDLWLSDNDQFAQVDFSKEEPIAQEDLVPEPIVADVEEFPQPIVDTVDRTPEPEPPKGPEVFKYSDGSSLTVEHSKRGWKATLDTGLSNVNPEVFYGKTKEEMYQNVAAGKINATKKIRELNKKVQLGMDRPKPRQQEVKPAARPYTAGRDLTADEIVEIKTELMNNPDLAFDKLFQIKTGLNVRQLATLVQEANARSEKGQEASDALESEAVAKAFMEGQPNYLPSMANYEAMLAWLAKYKLNESLTQTNGAQIMLDLLHKGFWTVEALDEAFESLTESGLLDVRRDQTSDEVEDEPEVTIPQPVARVERTAPKPPVVANVETDVTPTDGRIARITRRPRAGLGIRPSEASGVSPNTSTAKPPSEAELESLSDDEITQLFAAVRRERSRSR